MLSVSTLNDTSWKSEENQETKPIVDFDDVISTFNRTSNFFVVDGYSIDDAKKFANDAVKTKYGRDLLGMLGNWDYERASSAAPKEKIEEIEEIGETAEERGCAQTDIAEERGYSQTDIAEELGFYKGFVSSLLILGGYLSWEKVDRARKPTEKAAEFLLGSYGSNYGVRYIWKRTIIPVIKDLWEQYKPGGINAHLYLTPTEIGKRLNLSANSINNVLTEADFQVRLTKEGCSHHVYDPKKKGWPYCTERIITPGIRSKSLAWHESIIPIIKKLLSEKYA